MKLKSLLLAATAGILMLAPMSVGAATLTDSDGIISKFFQRERYLPE